MIRTALITLEVTIEDMSSDEQAELDDGMFDASEYEEDDEDSDITASEVGALIADQGIDNEETFAGTGWYKRITDISLVNAKYIA